jgi:hypothetical protein
MIAKCYLLHGGAIDFKQSKTKVKIDLSSLDKTQVDNIIVMELYE